MKKWMVLIVDDEMEIAEYVGDLVREVLGAKGEITISYSGTRALRILEEKEMDLIISDIIMPVTNGFNILEYASEHLPDAEVILLTAHEEFDYIYRANKIKRCSYIVKGESEQNIKGRIQSVLEEMEGRIQKEQVIENAKQQIQEVRERYSDSKVRQLRTYMEEEANCDLELIQKMRTYIKQQSGGNVTVKELAGYFHYSEAYLSKIFKQYTDENLSSYIMKQKIHTAKKMLSETRESIQDISEKLGYHSSQAFGRAFRRELNMTPQEYRREYWNDRAERKG